jgi:FkbM family methyltransferase
VAPGLLALHPPGDYVSDVIRSTGDWFERPVLDEIARRVTGGVLIDAGAMIGNHTAYMALFVPHTEIHAFEPLPANLELLRANVAGYPSVKVHPVALSDRGSTVGLISEPENLGHARIAEEGGYRVRAIPLDAYQLVDVALIKIDVEGHEPQVLAGARETIARSHPLIVIEDWKLEYATLLPGYELAVAWEEAHQTFLYEWAG